MTAQTCNGAWMAGRVIEQCGGCGRLSVEDPRIPYHPNVSVYWQRGAVRVQCLSMVSPSRARIEDGCRSTPSGQGGLVPGGGDLPPGSFSEEAQ